MRKNNASITRDEAPSPNGRVGAFSAARIPLRAFIVPACVLAAAILLVSGVAWARSRSAPSHAAAPSGQMNPSDIAALSANVARHIVINAGEQPTVATVENPDALRAQNPIFYKDAQKGDRLLIWSDKAVLYSPSTDRLLAVLPINYPVSNPPAEKTASKSASAKTKR